MTTNIIDKNLILALQEEDETGISFLHICERDKRVFGTTGTSRRAQARLRRKNILEQIRRDPVHQKPIFSFVEHQSVHQKWSARFIYAPGTERSSKKQMKNKLSQM